MLRRALSKKREDRFPTINAFARAFEAAAREGSAASSARAATLEQQPEPRRPRAQAQARTRGGLWLSIGVLGLILAGAAWVFRDELPLPKWWPGETTTRGARPAGGPTVEPVPGDPQRRHPPAQRR